MEQQTTSTNWLNLTCLSYFLDLQENGTLKPIMLRQTKFQVPLYQTFYSIYKLNNSNNFNM